MATVAELSAPYENYLLPVLPAGDGVCSVCHTSTAGAWAQCYQCNEAARALRTCADAVDFVALAVKGEQLARELWVYKNGRSAPARDRPRYGLAAVLWRWLAEHEVCVAQRAGADEFPLVTTVPSTSGRATHPLDDVVGRLVGATKHRYRDLLIASDPAESGREARQDRFRLRAAVPQGVPILIIDDTWTSGGHAQSAAATLRVAGAGPVGVVAIGRHFNREPAGERYREPAERYYREALSRGWDWSRCCLCGDR